MAIRSDRVASDTVAVTTSDTNVVDYVGLYIGVSGDVAIKGDGGTAVTFKSVPVGFLRDIHITTVMATGTTATNILGLKA